MTGAGSRARDAIEDAAAMQLEGARRGVAPTMGESRPPIETIEVRIVRLDVLWPAATEAFARWREEHPSLPLKHEGPP